MEKFVVTMGLPSNLNVTVDMTVTHHTKHSDLSNEEIGERLAESMRLVYLCWDNEA